MGRHHEAVTMPDPPEPEVRQQPAKSTAVKPAQGSVKAASDIYSPVSGEVVEINPVLEDEPETVNHSPYADGWMFRVKITDQGELDEMLDADGYQAAIEES